MKQFVRSFKDNVMLYDEGERLVRDATSNEPWGASSTLMHQIADMTNQRDHYGPAMSMLWKRITDVEYPRHVLKALLLVEFLLRNGSERFVLDMKQRRKRFEALSKFKDYTEQAEIGVDVRAKATSLLILLDDDAKRNEERAIALRTKQKITGISNTTNGSSSFGSSNQSASSYGSSNNDAFGGSNDRKTLDTGGDFGSDPLSSPVKKAPSDSEKKEKKKDKKKKKKKGGDELEEDEPAPVELAFESPAAAESSGKMKKEKKEKKEKKDKKKKNKEEVVEAPQPPSGGNSDADDDMGDFMGAEEPEPAPSKKKEKSSKKAQVQAQAQSDISFDFMAAAAPAPIAAAPAAAAADSFDFFSSLNVQTATASPNGGNQSQWFGDNQQIAPSSMSGSQQSGQASLFDRLPMSSPPQNQAPSPKAASSSSTSPAAASPAKKSDDIWSNLTNIDSLTQPKKAPKSATTTPSVLPGQGMGAKTYMPDTMFPMAPQQPAEQPVGMMGAYGMPMPQQSAFGMQGQFPAQQQQSMFPQQGYPQQQGQFNPMQQQGFGFPPQQQQFNQMGGVPQQQQGMFPMHQPAQQQQSMFPQQSAQQNQWQM